VSCLVLFCILLFFVSLCFFVISCGSSAPNEDIVRLKCRGSNILFFVKFFVKIFKFCYSFLGFRVVYAFFSGF